MNKPALIKIIFPFFLLIILIQQITVLPGCANIIPPEGGPRDSLPPVLRRSTPADSSRNFGDNKITLTFDEYVNADNYLQEMIVSPVPANMPTVTRKLNVVTVKLRDTLEPNTTYTVNFGSSIKDVNEGNSMKNFTYLFSTGPYIDSLEFTGNVLLAETGLLDTTLTVLLHKTNIDSALIKEKPRYVTKLDGRGNFRFKNLPPGTFYAYALKDEGGSYRYMSKTQLFAFSDSAVIVGSKTQPLTLYAYAGKETTLPPKPAAETRNTKQADKRLKFSMNLSGGRQDLLDSFIMVFESKLKVFDTSKLHFSTDTTFIPLTDYRWELDSIKKKASLNYPWQENVLYNLVLEKDFATDTFGYQLLKADTISFKAKEKREYGKLTLRFRNLDLSQNPVLYFVQNNDVKKIFPLSSTNFSQALFIPGDYTLRILNDSNQNGMWDPGVFFGKRQQPELVKPVHRSLDIRADRDNSFDIDVTAPPPKEKDIKPTNPSNRGVRPNNNTRPINRSIN